MITGDILFQHHLNTLLTISIAFYPDGFFPTSDNWATSGPMSTKCAAELGWMIKTGIVRLEVTATPDGWLSSELTTWSSVTDPVSPLVLLHRDRWLQSKERRSALLWSNLDIKWRLWNQPRHWSSPGGVSLSLQINYKLCFGSLFSVSVPVKSQRYLIHTLKLTWPRFKNIINGLHCF